MKYESNLSYNNLWKLIFVSYIRTLNSKLVFNITNIKFYNSICFFQIRWSLFRSFKVISYHFYGSIVLHHCFNLLYFYKSHTLQRNRLLCIVWFEWIFWNGAIPFFYEQGVEMSYPAAEGITVGVTSFSNQLRFSIFLFAPLGNLGTKWMIWATVLI